jgi:hypothetical protein
MKKLLILVLASILIFSCKTRNGISIHEKEIKFENANAQNLFKAIAQPVEFSTLKIKANADIESGNSYPSVALTLYIDRGNQIWANASLILPLARACIYPGGFKMYERLGKTYIDSNFDYLNNLLQVDFLTYKNLEDLLIGKIFFPLDAKDFNFSIENNYYILTSKRSIKVGSGKETRNFSRKLIFDSNYNLRQINMEDPSKNTYLQIDYDDYINIEYKILPKNIKIFIKGEKEIKITLNYNKFEFVNMETPFEIPKEYSQRKIN